MRFNPNDQVIILTFLCLFLGFDSMTTRHFKKISDPDHGHAWVRSKTGKSKNYQNDSEDLRKGGLIPYGKNKHGFDAGLFIEDYQKLLNPGNKNMFQRPKYGKAFTKNLHKKKKGQEVYYCKTKIGHTYVGKFMPKVNIKYIKGQVI